jgi:hypothetical protein
MRQVIFTANPPGPVVRARVQFIQGGSTSTHNTQISFNSQGYQVLDGRAAPFSFQAAIQANELPNPSQSCADFTKGIGKLTILGQALLDVQEDYCIGVTMSGDINMGPGAELLIKQGSGLLLKGDVHGCSDEQLWRRIQVESGGRLEFYASGGFNYGVISDAARAIQLQGGSIARIRNAYFVNNHVGMYLDGFEQPLNQFTAPYLAQFSNVHFTSSINGGTLGSPIDSDLLGHPEASATQMFAGVVVKSCDLVRLGDADNAQSDWNSYSNLPNGIYIEHSNVQVAKSTFDVYEDPLSTAPSGYAIYSRGSGHHWLEVKGISGQQPIAVYAPYGIRSDFNRSTQIRRVHFYQAERAVETRSLSALARVQVEQCSLVNTANHGLRHYGLGEVNYWNNYIHMRDLQDVSTIKGRAILTNAILKHGAQKLSIKENMIDLIRGQGGIESWMSSGVISENTVQIETADLAVRHGIAWMAPYQALLSCNLIQGPSYGGLSQTDALYLGNSSATEVTCNEVDEVGAGLRLFGMHNAMQIRANTFGDHELGLAYGYANPADQTITGQQALRGNYWPDMHSNASIGGRYGAIHYGNSQNVNFSKYIVNNSADQAFMPKWSANGDWFNSQVGVNQDCFEEEEAICDLGPGAFGPPVVDDIDVRFLQDSMPHPEWQYTGARRLMQRISDHPSMLEDVDIADFYDAAMQSDLGAWHDVDQQMQHAWVVDSILKSSLDAAEAALYAQAGKIMLAQDSLALAGTETDSLYWRAQLDTAYMDYHPLYSDWSHLFDSVQQIAIGRLMDARTDNTALTTSGLWLENEKAVRHIALAMVIEQRDTLSGTEVATLEDIADQCPTWGGDAVYLARAILLGVGTYDWDNRTLCVEAEERHAYLGRPLAASLQVQPNPARDQISVLSESRPGSALRLVDMYGRILRSDIYTGHGHQISVSALPAGRYVVQLFDVAGQVQVASLQVIR